jgi:hypothetical protein
MGMHHPDWILHCRISAWIGFQYKKSHKGQFPGSFYNTFYRYRQLLQGKTALPCPAPRQGGDSDVNQHQRTDHRKQTIPYHMG